MFMTICTRGIPFFGAWGVAGRPYRNIVQFGGEVGRHVGYQEVERLERYVAVG